MVDQRIQRLGNQAHRTGEAMLRRLRQELNGIEERTDLDADEKVRRIIATTSVICAGVAIQPIPFADMPVLTSIQGVMGWKIAQVRGVPVNPRDLPGLIRYVGGVAGLGWAAQHMVIGLYKLGLPAAGAITTVPLVGGLTYGIGRLMDVYFTARASGRQPDSAALRAAFREGKRRGAVLAKEEVADGTSESGSP